MSYKRSRVEMFCEKNVLKCLKMFKIHPIRLLLFINGNTTPCFSFTEDITDSGKKRLK